MEQMNFRGVRDQRITHRGITVDLYGADQSAVTAIVDSILPGQFFNHCSGGYRGQEPIVDIEQAAAVIAAQPTPWGIKNVEAAAAHLRSYLGRLSEALMAIRADFVSSERLSAEQVSAMPAARDVSVRLMYSYLSYPIVRSLADAAARHAEFGDARVEPADTAPSSPGTFVSPVQYAQDIGLL